jgi:hypothetical protein
VHLADVLEDRDHKAERGGRQRDRQQQRFGHPPGRGERRARAVTQHQRRQEAEYGEAEQAAAQLVHVDFQAGQEQQEH